VEVDLRKPVEKIQAQDSIEARERELVADANRYIRDNVSVYLQSTEEIGPG
jgi:hypothetical protein